MLSGYFGFNNSGDDAILKSMVENLKATGLYELTVLSSDPESTQRTYEVDSVDRFSIRDVMKAMKNTDIFVFGGGSLLQDITSTRSLMYYLSLLNLASMYKKKIFVFANGIGPIDSKFNRRLTGYTLNKSDTITLRDEDSVEFVENLKIKGPRIVKTADPVFLIDPVEDSRVKEILENENINLTDNTVAISLRDWPLSKDLNLEIVKFCDMLVDEDVSILLVPMHYPYDLDYMKVIMDKSKNPNISILEDKYDVEEIIGILEMCKVSIAMRLHGLIYSSVAKLPTIGLIYDPKVYGLIQELDIQEYVDVEKADGDSIYKLYKDLMDNIEDRRARIVKSVEKEKEESRLTINELGRLINE